MPPAAVTPTAMPNTQAVSGKSVTSVGVSYAAIAVPVAVMPTMVPTTPATPVVFWIAIGVARWAVVARTVNAGRGK